MAHLGTSFLLFNYAWHFLLALLVKRRMRLFNSVLSEILFRPRLDMMEVEDMVEKLNEHHKSTKPFTLLEIKPYLQKLHDDNRIFMVEDEGKMGIVYVVWIKLGDNGGDMWEEDAQLSRLALSSRDLAILLSTHFMLHHRLAGVVISWFHCLTRII